MGMGLSNDLISQFVKITKDDTNTKKETFAYGTVVEQDNKKYVQLDGSKILTPISNTSNIGNGDRVTVMIKNHTAMVTGNLTSPSARIITKEDGTQTVENLNIDELLADNVTIKNKLSASEADISELQAKNVTITNKISAAEGDIANLKVSKIDATTANAKFATIENLDVTNGKIHNLETTYTNVDGRLTANEADIKKLDADKVNAKDIQGKFANIDFSNIGQAAIQQFFSKSGMISDLTVGDGTITGKLVGVTISGDLIEGNTVKAEKLVVKGSDGLYYKLNIEAGATTSETVSASDLQNGLHGTAIIAKTITAEKISVKDLVAFGATIGGFNISEDSLYSGVKSSTANTTRGVYLDSTGQMAVGDSNNFLRYYLASDGTYKLEISASSIIFGASKKSVETVINDVQTSVDNLKIGGRNLLIGSSKWDDFTCLINDRVDTTYISVTPGEELTVSYDVKSTNDNTGNVMLLQYFKIDPNNIDNRHSYIWTNHAVTTEYVRHTHTFTIPDEILYLRIGLRSSNGYINTYRKIKVERGNKATDWTPAPEDMATNQKVDDVSSKINGRNLIIRSESTEDAYYDQSGTFITITGSGTAAMTSYIAITPNTKYTFSRSAGGGDFFRFNWYDADKNYIGRKAITEISDGQEGVYTWTSPNTAYYLLVSYPWELKSKAMLEIGDRATEWSLAEEDVVSEEKLSKTNARVAATETIIEQLSNSISMLVTDGNGTSLMTQTDTGWTFSTAEIQSAVNRTSDSLNTLTNEVGNIDSVVSILQEAVADLGTIAEYVKITTYEDEPCIELGEGDSDFKLRITNTRMMFTEGSTTLAYFNNQSFHVKKAVIEEELQQGGFIWKVRSNGNLGLVWKGVT